MIDRAADSSRRTVATPPSTPTPPGTGPLVVRPATPRDLPLVVDLRLALLREHRRHPIYGRLRPDAPDRARRLFAAQLRAPDEVIYLAERDGAAVGILRCLKVGGLPLLFPATHGYLSSVYVVPAARRQGVLRAMLDAAIAWCRDRGLTEIRLHNASDNDAADAAWEALGFRIVEHLRLLRIR